MKKNIVPKASVSFSRTIKDRNIDLTRLAPEILQVNVGKYCNQACLHCHVEAGPKRTEKMTEKNARKIVDLIEATPSIHTVDITGGAPELHPVFRLLVEESFRLDKKIIDRCNLTVFFEEGQEDLPEFLVKHKVNVTASLPCYSKDNVEKQRGKGVFDKSIRALQLLNELGYGSDGSGLELDLVYNPLGASLPPDQLGLQEAYKKELKELFEIEFNKLFTITNMPIKRFLWDLERSNKLDEYMDLLLTSFNPHAAEGVMCRNLVSVGYDGEVFDCDFNQMLDISLKTGKTTIWDIDNFDFRDTSVVFADHCYGCTAGAGSSCTGSLT